MARTLLDKVWDAHTVRVLPSGQTQLLIGLHLIHEVTTPQAFQMLKELKLKVRMPERTFGTLDHRSEEHTSELQSRLHLVCRLLLEKKKELFAYTRESTVVRIKPKQMPNAELFLRSDLSFTARAPNIDYDTPSPIAKKAQ